MGTQPTGPSVRRGAGLGEYLKRAFLYRWNVLVFAAGLAASLLSPWPDALLPLVAAGELLYLSRMVYTPRFREAVDAQVYRQAKESAAVTAPRSLQDIVGALTAESQRRFQQLRARCLEMRVIAQGVRGRTGAEPAAAEDMSASALDRLLWVFLRLLTSQQALNRFLQGVDAAQIRARLEEAKARLEAQRGDERIVRSLEDSIAAHSMRLDNFQKAQQNAEFVRVELDRIEAKIQALTEASVNRQDPDFLSSQIDAVSESMQSTERAISELRQITGLVDEMEEPPAILGADPGKVAQR